MGRGTDAAVATWRRVHGEVLHFARMWREAETEDRAVVYFLAGWAGIFIAAALWLGS
jgi:hypothetical protein